jgi:aspartate kinase
MIVMKFGGTSNEDAAAMTNVIRIVTAHLPQHPVVVISAIAKATNELEQAARTAAAGDATGAVRLLGGLFARHDGILEDLLRDRSRIAALRESFASWFGELKELVQGVSILRELTPRTMEAFCSYGERLSSRIVDAGLEESGVTSAWIDAREFMITDDSFGRARPLMDEVTERLERVARPLVEAGKVPVTQGFIGVTRSGVSTTMGRESSDYSASIIGAAMNAARVQIWTDVDGILTADPRMVGNVRKVKRMSFEEAFELSYFGAKVLHPNTMLPLLQKNIPVEIRNSRTTEGTGTLVDLRSADGSGAPLVKSIAFKPGITVFSVSPRTRLNQYLFWEGVFSVLNRSGIGAGNVSTSEYNIAFTHDGAGDVESLAQQVGEHGDVTVMRGKGSICIVGNSLRGCPGLLTRVFDALAGVSITMVAYGASGLNVTVVMDGDRVPDALARLHKEFFGAAEKSDVFDVPAN